MSYVVVVFDVTDERWENALWVSDDIDSPDPGWLAQEGFTEIQGVVALAAPEYCPWDCDRCRDE